MLQSLEVMHSSQIGLNTQWIQAGIAVNTIVPHDQDDLDTLFKPYGIDVDDDRTVVITDYLKHRVVEWNIDATEEQSSYYAFISCINKADWTALKCNFY
ncbi:hypothetical protein I4U23_003553 [Adineta vaga]|nr:hypothetical protein I4U23_003553 [Adineta vaga]